MFAGAGWERGQLARNGQEIFKQTPAVAGFPEKVADKVCNRLIACRKA